jgi:hypothetical protein
MLVAVTLSGIPRRVHAGQLYESVCFRSFKVLRRFVMVKSVKEKATEVGTSVSKAAKSGGCEIAKGAEVVVDCVMEKAGIETDDGKDFGVAGIKEHMDVIASCGKQVGVVDDVQTSALKLTRKDSPDDQHHFIPLSWISRVDSQVHLNKNSKEAVSEWKSNALSCDCDAQPKTSRNEECDGQDQKS